MSSRKVSNESCLFTENQIYVHLSWLRRVVCYERGKIICQGTHFIIQSALSIAKWHLNQSFSIFIYVLSVVLTFGAFKLLKVFF